jgi:hypothetical protein
MDIRYINIKIKLSKINLTSKIGRQAAAAAAPTLFVVAVVAHDYLAVAVPGLTLCRCSAGKTALNGFRAQLLATSTYELQRSDRVQAMPTKQHIDCRLTGQQPAFAQMPKQQQQQQQQQH